MKKLLLYLVITLLIANLARSQTGAISGIVADTSEQKNLTNAVISVLRKSDSLLLRFTRSDKSGNFIMNKLPAGKSILMISFPKYADFVDDIDIKENSNTELGKIIMTLKSQLLAEVVVTNSASIRIKGDTTEYKIDSFHLRPGATVEEMLKKLPGIQVDKNGKITAQGETVQKVLVDGEEFFSDDPTVVTQNMLSEAIDKVQVYDKKSDQAAFTGIDDGKKMKTIDLKLKDNRKKGYFGKAELGSDFNKYWNNSAMINAFKAKRKFSAFGVMSNTGKIGLDFRERSNYGSVDNMESSEDGSLYFVNYGEDDFDRGGFYGEGTSKGWNGGMLYSNKWNQDKISLNSSYQYKKINIAAEGATQSKYILPDTLYYLNDRGKSYTSKFRNTLNGKYEYQIDTSSTLKITADGYTGKSSSVNNSYSESLDRSGNFVNTSDRTSISESDNSSVNSSLLYRKKFKKQGRTISLNIKENYNASKSESLLNADYKYYDEDGAVKKEERTDQKRLRDNLQSSVSSKLVYTEPLSKKSNLEFNYSINNNYGRSLISTLEKSATSNGKYEEEVDSLSNKYALNVLTNAAGINYRYARPKKINFSFGGNMSYAAFQRKDIRADSSFSYSFVNIFPRASLSITTPKGGNLSFEYNGSTQAPSIDQIQPIKDNSNILNQQIGNPDLKQSFRQNFSVGYNSFKLLSETNIYTRINLSTVNRDFSDNNFVDDLGRRLSQPVNVNGNHSINAYLYYGRKIKPGVHFGMDMGVNKRRNTNFINTLKNINNSYGINGAPQIYIEKEKKFSIVLMPRFGWNHSTSSIRPDETAEYLTQDHYAELQLYLPGKIEFNTDCTFSIRQKTDAFDRNTNSTKWNARIDKKVMKDAGIIRLAAFDILDQNIGFDRDVQSNFISEKTYNTFKRYFMVSVIYNFNKNGKPR